MKFIIRSGKVRGEGDYWCENFYHLEDFWSATREYVRRFDSLEQANSVAARLGVTRIVRLLSHEEAKAKAVREALSTKAAESAFDPDESMLLNVRMARVLDAIGVPPTNDTVTMHPTIQRFLWLMNDLDRQFKRAKPLQDLIDMAMTAPNFATSRAVKDDMEYEINVKRADGRWPIDVIEELKAELEKVKAKLAAVWQAGHLLAEDIQNNGNLDDASVEFRNATSVWDDATNEWRMK